MGKIIIRTEIWLFLIFLVLVFGIMSYNRKVDDFVTATAEEVANTSQYSEIFNMSDADLQALGLKRESIYKCMTRVGGETAQALE